MISLWSIIKLTARAAIRSHIFQLLLALLLLCVFLLPLTIAGDGTAYGYIQISLKYSLEACAFILALSCIWLGCFSLSQDVESYQLHMVVSKPTSRVKIWLGKCLGVILIHGVLLLIAAMVIYGMILWQFSRQSFTQAEKNRIENEVLVGRRVFYPVLPDINQLARELFSQRLNAAKQSASGTISIDERTAMPEMRKQVMASLSEVKFGPSEYRMWEFKDIPTEPLYLRFRTYVNKVSTKDQRITVGVWNVVMEVPTDTVLANGKKKMQQAIFPVSNPKQYMTGVFHELALSPEIVQANHSVEVVFVNLDPEKKTLYFQLTDGPKLLVKVSGFLGNYLRAVLVIMMGLVIFSALACAAAGIMSMPVAVFTVISYLLFGIFAQYLVGAEDSLEGASAVVGYWVSKALLLAVIPMQNFEVSRFIANGELIEFAFIAKLFLYYFVLRGLPLFLLGIYFYNRRELGLIIRK